MSGTIQPDDDTVNRILSRQRARDLLMIGEGDCREEALEIASTVLTGRADPLVTGALADHVKEVGVRLPPGFPELLRHEGVDPDGLLALSVLIGEDFTCVVRDLDGDRNGVTAINWGMSDCTWVTLGGTAGINWRDGHILLPALPEAVSLEMIGKPLSTLISHPVLDGMDITITEITPQWEDPDTIEVWNSLYEERVAEEDVVHERVESILQRLIAGKDELTGLKTLKLGGLTVSCILDGHSAVEPVIPIGINCCIVRTWSDERIEALLVEQIAKWRKRYVSYAP